MRIPRSAGGLCLTTVVASLFFAAGCSPDVDGGSGSVDEQPITTTTTDFGTDKSSPFVEGTPPNTASFDGGGTVGGRWIIPEGTTGVVLFATPSRDVSMTLENQPTVAIANLGFAKVIHRRVYRKTACGVSDQGLDNGEAFGGNDVYVRGVNAMWDVDPARQMFNFGNNVYQAEFEVVGETTEYKIADASWDAYAVSGQDGETQLNTPTVLADAKFGGPNGTITFPNDGCYNWSMDATDPEAPVLTVTEVIIGEDPGGGGGTCGVGDQGLDNGEAFGGNDVYVRGVNAMWDVDPARQLFNFGDNIYQAEFEVVGETTEYKIADASWDAYAVSGQDGETLLDTPTVLADAKFGGPNGTITFPNDGCFNWTLDATDPEAPILTVSEVILTGPPGGGGGTCGVGDQGLDNGEAFGGNDVFVRGVNAMWDVDPDRQLFNFGDNIYQAEFEVVGETTEYKIADASWDAYAVSGQDGETLLDTPTVLADAKFGGPNGTITFPNDGCFNWTLDATDPEAPILIVTEVDLSGGGGKTECGVDDQGLDNGEAFGGNDIYVRGVNAMWDVDPERQMFNFGNNNYQAEFEVIGGTTEYKIADSSWDAYAVSGQDGETLLNTPTVLADAKFGGPNGTITFPNDGCFNWSMDATDPEAPVLTVTEVQLGGGEPPPAGNNSVRWYDADGNEISEDELMSPGMSDLGLSRSGGETPIGRVEFDALSGDIAVDSMSWTSNPRDQLPPGERTLFYHNASGNYANTVITIDGEEFTCDPAAGGGFGCAVVFDSAPANSVFTFTVSVDGVPDPTGTFVGSSGGDGDNIYAFSGNPQSVTGEVAGIPGEDEVILYYKRTDDVYDDWTVHLFPTGSPDWTNFNPGLCFVEGTDPQLGGFFRITLPPNDCYDANPPELDEFPAEVGFIIHRGDEKDPGPDQFFRIAEDGNILFVTSGVDNVGSAPPNANEIAIVGRAAHWIDRSTLLWGPGADVVDVELLWSASANISGGATVGGEDGSALLEPGTNPQPDNQRHLSSLPAFTVPASAADNAEALARQQLVVVGKNRFGEVLEATFVQTPGLLDDLYAADATDDELGVTWDGGTPTIRVWAPTALTDTGVSLELYETDGTPISSVPMTLDEDSGVWSATGDASWDRKYYRFKLDVYTYAQDRIVTNEVTDPYSLSLSANSRYSQVINLDDLDLKPAGWDALTLPAVSAPEDIAIYEIQMRDFSVFDETVPDNLQGTYGAFAETTTDGHAHLQALSDAGLTHVHVLPAFDIGTINEVRAERVEIEDQTDDLCAANSGAQPLCDKYPGQTIESALEAETAEDPTSELQQQVATVWQADLDGYNWGYDPFHYGVPEGSYSTDPEGPARIIEFRQMVAGLAGKGLRTVMDVVYNHTNQGGQGERSVLDRVVPGYYHRYNETTGSIEQSTCCSNTATEFAMMEKLMVDTLVVWTRDYKVGGFRFDLMGFHTKANMEKVRDTLRALDSGMYIYGEGWIFGEVANDRRFEQATQGNVSGTGLGTFTDRIRDAIRGGGPFDSGEAHIRTQGFMSGGGYDPNELNDAADQGFIDEALLSADQIRVGMAGSITSFTFTDSNDETVTGEEVPYGSSPTGYVFDPEEIINYSASHDNETIWDISQYKHPTTNSIADRVRAHNIGTDLIVLAQGIPFLHAGQDLMRSKSTDRDSFNSGDWFNRLDFTYQTNNWAVGLPGADKNAGNYEEVRPLFENAQTYVDPADIQFTRDHTREMLEIRSSSSLFRLRTPEQINQRVEYWNTGSSQVLGLIVQSIDGCTDSQVDQPFDEIVTIVNANDEAQTIDLFTDKTFTLHPVLATSVDPVVQTATHDSTNGFQVPARTTAVFVRQEAQKETCAPFGADVFVRGLNGAWDATPDNQLQFEEGTTNYSVRIEVNGLTAPDLSFKVASADWAAVSCGAGADPNVSVDTPYALNCADGSGDLALDVMSTGPYTFHVDAADTDNPVLLVTEGPTYATDLYVRGFAGAWDATDANRMRYIGDQAYQVQIPLADPAAPGALSFKVADASWDIVNCGAQDGAATATPGTAYALNCDPTSGDVVLDTNVAGNYAFTVDATDPANPTVTVEQTPFAAEVFVRGLNASWDATPSNSMSLVSGTTTYEVIMPVTGTTVDDLSFKIASFDWSTVDCGSGATDTVDLDTPFAMNCAGGGNVNLNVPGEGNVKFTLDAADTTNPTLTVTGQ